MLTCGQALAALLLAVLSWGGVWWWQSRHTSPSAENHLEAGWLLYREGRVNEAENEWLEAVRLSPKDVVAWQALGDLYLASGQWEPARKAYGIVAQLNPSTPGLWTRMARAEVSMGNAPGARAAVDAALARDPQDAEALNILSTLLKRAEESKNRIQVLQRLVKIKPNDVPILIKTADALMIARRYSEAKPLVDRVLSLDPRSNAALSMRGALAFKQDSSPASLARAASDLRAAIALNPANWVARWYLGRCYLRLNQPKQALSELKAVHDTGPSSKSYMIDLASAYAQNGQEKQAAAMRLAFAAAERETHAINELRSRLAASPNDFESNLQLGLLLLRSRKPDGADSLLQTALRLRPKDAQAQKAVRDLETEYVRSLSDGLENLRAKKGVPALQHLSRALHLKPADPRTQKAVEELAAALGINFYQAQLQLERLSQN